MFAPDDKLRRYVVRHIADNVRCASCHHGYMPADIHVVAHRESMWFVRVQCHLCGAEGLILVMVENHAENNEPWSLSQWQGEAPSPYGTLPKRTEPDAGPITAREIDQLREYLRFYDGNFSELAEGA